jgi:hypothetical protein
MLEVTEIAPQHQRISGVLLQIFGGQLTKRRPVEHAFIVCRVAVRAGVGPVPQRIAGENVVERCDRLLKDPR